MANGKRFAIKLHGYATKADAAFAKAKRGIVLIPALLSICNL
ncbi:MAG: hypothetical protein PHN61_14725 [Methanothrix sp.]|nr:hypothetical protein [Methanothrix sp.]